MMKAAFACWEDRIAPVFDTTRQIDVVEAESGRIIGQTRVQLPEDGLPVQKALHLSELGVGALVCGAISRPLHAIVAGYGIQVIPFVAGELREVIQAWLRGKLDRDAFAMPGCCGQGRRRRHEPCETTQEEAPMNRRTRAGTMQGAGQGGHRRGQGRGRLGGPLAGGTCLCPKCGHREPHERGVPCVQKTCPQCGTTMTRE